MNIAVIGATGLVGRSIIEILNEKNLIENNNIFLFASKKSVGKKIKINKKYYKIYELNEENIKNKFDLALFSAGSGISKEWADKFIKCGAFVVDNSSAYRRNKKIPLVVPEVNGEILTYKDKLIANPNCSTIGMSLPLYYLSKVYNIKRVIVSTYQAVSGAGQKGVSDLINNTTYKFSYKIKGNLIPKIDYALDNGYTFEEDKMRFELRKILNNKKLKVSTTCVRVPVVNAHSESAYIEFDKEPDIEEIKSILSQADGVKLIDNLKNDEYPMPILVDGQDDVYVGRIRKDTSNKKAISLFISFDNIRKGASLNAVQIAEILIKKFDLQ